MIKAAGAPYDVGRRGSAWVKVKPRHTLDLVILAAEWGHGRRRGWLSNLHLGARDPAGGFVMLGKTFKGLTDAMLRVADRAAARARRRPGRLGGHGAPRAGGRDRLRRRPGQHPLPGRGDAAVRPGAALPGGQAGRRGGHPRRRSGPSLTPPTAAPTLCRAERDGDESEPGRRATGRPPVRRRRRDGPEWTRCASRYTSSRSRPGSAAANAHHWTTYPAFIAAFSWSGGMGTNAGSAGGLWLSRVR